MDLGPRMTSYNAPFTQGDRLNRIKVIRKRNKQHSKGESDKEVNNRCGPTELANSYPRAGGNASGSALDFREIYNLHYEAADDAFANAEFNYESENSALPASVYRKAGVLPSTPNASKERASSRPVHLHDDSIDIRPR